MSNSSLIRGGLSGSALMGVLHRGSSRDFLMGAEMLGRRATPRPPPPSSLSAPAPAASEQLQFSLLQANTLCWMNLTMSASAKDFWQTPQVRVSWPMPSASAETRYTLCQFKVLQGTSAFRGVIVQPSDQILTFATAQPAIGVETGPHSCWMGQAILSLRIHLQDYKVKRARGDQISKSAALKWIKNITKSLSLVQGHFASITYAG